MSAEKWRDPELSDEEANPTPSGSTVKKRSSRACDSCRKTKSKCERSLAENSPCKSCTILGTECTFLGPSYKRGPPKGYIHAIETRWHQVESLLGALLASADPRVQSVVSDLRQDSLAREIINRVDRGPFGPSGRHKQPAGATKEDFFATIMDNGGGQEIPGNASDLGRSRRQSRVSREIVSSTTDEALSVIPTMEWQDRLSAKLASASSRPSSTGSTFGASTYSSGSSGSGNSYASSSGHVPAAFPTSANNTIFDYSAYPPQSTRDAAFHTNSGEFNLGGSEPVTQKRRLDVPGSEPDWNQMYKFEVTNNSDTEDSEAEEAADGIGQLSLDEHLEVRFHGKASGLHLLPREDRTDDRNEGGIWRLPMARVWPAAKGGMTWQIAETDIEVKMPPIEMQDHYIKLYFTYVHPVFPVIHKGHFLAEYAASKQSTPSSPEDTASVSPKPEPSQTVSKLLLLTIFCMAARYTEQETMPQGKPHGKMWEAGCGFLEDAREILNRVFHRSRASTCQSLLLLGYREFGIGSMEQGWNYIGQAMRMAHDLGLNRNSDKWQYHGRALFSANEKQIRKQIWWGCFIADRYASVYMGRPVYIREDAYDTPLPEITDEDDEIWEPMFQLPARSTYKPVHGWTSTCFRAGANLAVIVGEIVSSIYPVRSPNRQPRLLKMLDLERRLDQWYIELPTPLQYSHISKKSVPPPLVLYLHIRYWGAVLLLHRAFIPNWKGDEAHTETDGTSLKAFDICQVAASQVSAVVTVYSENFSLKRSSPMLSSYLLSSGIMNIVTLTMRPGDQQASLALRQCLSALQQMEMIWPSAERAYDLLSGALEPPSTPMPPPERHKRQAEDAFGEGSKNNHHHNNQGGGGQQRPQKEYNYTSHPDYMRQDGPGVQDFSARLLANMLDLDVPGAVPSTSYYPGYEWWPPAQALGPSHNGADMTTHQNVSGLFDLHAPPQQAPMQVPPPPPQQQQLHHVMLSQSRQHSHQDSWAQMPMNSNGNNRSQAGVGYDYFEMPLNVNPHRYQ